MVTYGGMSREPVTVLTAALIFKDISVRGFWMTRWSIDHAGMPEQTEMFRDLSNLYANGNLKAPAHKLIPFSNYKEGLENTMTVKGFTGLKYIFDFQSQWSRYPESQNQVKLAQTMCELYEQKDVKYVCDKYKENQK